MRRHPADPRWLTTKYRGTCASCAGPIPKGASAFYYPRTRQLFCHKQSCGQAEARDFVSHAMDEDVMAGSGTPFAN